MKLNVIKKIARSKTLGAVTSVATIISAIDGFVSERKHAKEFDNLKETVADLQKAVSELQKKN